MTTATPQSVGFFQGYARLTISLTNCRHAKSESPCSAVTKRVAFVAANVFVILTAIFALKFILLPILFLVVVVKNCQLKDFLLKNPPKRTGQIYGNGNGGSPNQDEFKTYNGQFNQVYPNNNNNNNNRQSTRKRLNSTASDNTNQNAPTNTLPPLHTAPVNHQMSVPIVQQYNQTAFGSPLQNNNFNNNNNNNNPKFNPLIVAAFTQPEHVHQSSAPVAYTNRSSQIVVDYNPYNDESGSPVLSPANYGHQTNFTPNNFFSGEASYDYDAGFDNEEDTVNPNIVHNQHQSSNSDHISANEADSDNEEYEVNHSQERRANN